MKCIHLSHSLMSYVVGTGSGQASKQRQQAHNLLTTHWQTTNCGLQYFCWPSFLASFSFSSNSSAQTYSSLNLSIFSAPHSDIFVVCCVWHSASSSSTSAASSSFLGVVKKSTFWLLRLGAHLVVSCQELKNCILLLIGALLFSTLHKKHITHISCVCGYVCYSVCFFQMSNKLSN